MTILLVKKGLGNDSLMVLHLITSDLAWAGNRIG